MKATAETRISNELGLHLRAAAAFVKLAERYQADVHVERDGQSANGKSIIALVTLAALKGVAIRISADGPDAEEAVGELVRLIDDRFGEPR